MDYEREVLSLDCDYHRLMPPSEIARIALGYCMESITADGGGRKELYEEFGAVWMITRLQMRQFDHVCAGDGLIYRTYPRCKSGGKYIYKIDVLRGEDKVASVDSMYIPVHFEKRTLIPIKRVDGIWKTPAAPEATNLFPKIRAHGEFSAHSKKVAAMSDCDPNKHVTTTRYIAMVCDCAGFWDDNSPNLMSRFQIDFTQEVLPGETMNFMRCGEDGMRVVRGKTAEGKTQFTATCQF